MEGPPLGPGGEDITWPDQVASRGRKASSTRKIKPQTSNPPGAPLVAPDPESIGTIAGQLVQVSKQDVVDNVHVGDVAKYSFFD